MECFQEGLHDLEVLLQEGWRPFPVRPGSSFGELTGEEEGATYQGYQDSHDHLPIPLGGAIYVLRFVAIRGVVVSGFRGYRLTQPPIMNILGVIFK